MKKDAEEPDTVTFITHNSVFHSDEIAAYALLKYVMGMDLNLIRTRDEEIIKNALKDKYTYVVDVGFVHDPDMLNFDHHQDRRTTKSAFGLLVDFLYERGALARLFVNEQAYDQFEEWLVAPIDLYDNNADGIIYKLSQLTSVSLQEAINGFNRDALNDGVQSQQFIKAADVMEQVIRNTVINANTYGNAVELYNNAEKKGGVIFGNEFIPFWKKLSNGKDIRFGVFPQSNEEYTVQSVNSHKYPLPDTEDNNLVFMHQGKFLAVFKNKDSAYNYAENLMRD